MSRLWIPDSLLKEICQNSDDYALLHCTLSKYKRIKKEELLRFLTIYYYMGIVRLPSKDDYWRKPSHIWPATLVPSCISRDRFRYIWKYLHLSPVGVTDESDTEDGDEDEEDPTDEQSVDSFEVSKQKLKKSKSKSPTTEDWYHKAKLTN